MVSLLLLGVVAVAAFNIVSTLVMSVAETAGYRCPAHHGRLRRWHHADFHRPWAGPGGGGISAGRAAGHRLGLNISRVTAFVETILASNCSIPVFISSASCLPTCSGRTSAPVLASLLLSLLATSTCLARATRIAPPRYCVMSEPVLRCESLGRGMKMAAGRLPCCKTLNCACWPGKNRDHRRLGLRQVHLLNLLGV